jgi:hypothetical protein
VWEEARLYQGPHGIFRWLTAWSKRADTLVGAQVAVPLKGVQAAVPLKGVQATLSFLSPKGVQAAVPQEGGGQRNEMANIAFGGRGG